METLSAIDTQNLNHGIQQIYALDDFEGFGRSALTIVHRLVPSDIPVFSLLNCATLEITDTFLPNLANIMTPELRGQQPRTLGEHPIGQNVPLPMHGAYKISDFVSPSELHSREELYQKFCKPLEIEDQMMINRLESQSETAYEWEQLPHSDVRVVAFVLNRNRRSFTERDRLMLNLLRPHLFQAYSNAQTFHQVSQDLGQLQQSLTHLGCIRLDTTGALQWITPQAELWLAQYLEPTTSPGHLPDSLWSWVQHQVQTLIARPHSPCLPLHIEQGPQRLVIRLIADPAHNRYTLLLEEQRQPSLQSLRSLGLSQRETEVVGCLIQGQDNKAIAAQLNVSASTISKHLENIYRKLGVQSRAAAIAQALQQLGYQFTP
jgi:DNA-binding CsgD family transcriptional regulator